MLTRTATATAPAVDPAAVVTGLHLQRVAADLNVLFLERAELIDTMMTALVGGLPMAIVSAPGTGKTALVDALFSYLDGPSFGWLMNRYTTPDEVFGAPSLKQLSENDKLVRNMEGKLPEAHLVKLDEGFKANSAMQNAQLGALNERLFEGVGCPWVGWFAMSNEYPDGIASGSSDGDSLAALWDRYILRMEIDYLAAETSVEQLLFSEVSGTPAPSVSTDAVREMQRSVSGVALPAVVRDALLEIRRELLSEGIVVSDRSMVRAARCVRARALAHGRDTATLSDLRVLAHVLWTTPEQRDKVAEIVRAVGAPQLAVSLAVEADVASLMAQFRSSTGAEQQAAGHSLSQRIDAHTRSLDALDTDDAEVADEIERVASWIDAMRDEVSETLFASLRGRPRA